MINAVAWKSQTGSQWVHLPAEYGSWKGVCTRLRNWAIDGAWERVFTALLAQADAEGDLDRVVPVDSTVVRAHQNAAGACQKGPPADEPDHHAIGRSRGGLSTRSISSPMAAAARCASSSRPARQATHPRSSTSWPHARAQSDRPTAHPAPRGPGGPALSSRAIREHLRRRNIRAVIPQPTAHESGKRKGEPRPDVEFTARGFHVSVNKVPCTGLALLAGAAVARVVGSHVWML